MKRIILNWLKKTATRELREAFLRNTTPDERITLTNYLIRIRDKMQPGCGQDITNIILQSLN